MSNYNPRMFSVLDLEVICLPELKITVFDINQDQMQHIEQKQDTIKKSDNFFVSRINTITS